MFNALSSGAGAPGDRDESQGNYGKPSKADMQREYRKREGEVFTDLRDIIRQLSGHDPQTRHDILSDATQLLRVLGDENANLRQQLPLTPAIRDFMTPGLMPEIDDIMDNIADMPPSNNTQYYRKHY